MRPSAKAANSEAPKGIGIGALRAFGAHRPAVGALPHSNARFCRGTASNPYRGSWSEAPAELASGLEVGAVPCGIVERALGNLSMKGVLHDWLLPWEFPILAFCASCTWHAGLLTKHWQHPARAGAIPFWTCLMLTPFGTTSVTRGDNAQLYELFPLN